MAKLIEKQKEVADLILDRLEYYDQHCVLVGGAPRDWLMGNPANDLDIFFCLPKIKTEKEVKSLLEKIFSDINGSFISINKKSKYYGRATYDFEINNVNVQLIKTDTHDVSTIMDSITLNISRVFYKNKTIMAKDKAFRIAIDKNTIICMDRNAGLSVARTNYIKKIRGRFPDYRYFDSPESYIDELTGFLL